MADSADSTPAPSGQFALTIADLNTAVNHEPRVKDLKLGFSLGMKNPASAMRQLIERHREALERFGEVSSTVDETSAKGGRPGRTFWLNKRQALYLCTKSETPRATETTIAMVEVFDAHLAARAAPPRPAPDRIGPVPFLAGPERLVSTLHLAQALRCRHTHVLRLADVLAAERPELLGTHLRFATYLHENRRSYRCFHMDRTGFDALMARVPGTDHRAVALRDATLADWPAEATPDAAPAVAAPAVAAPAPAAPTAPASPALAAAGATIERDGFAAMRLGGETLLVDLTRVEPGRPGRAVALGWDEAVTVVDLAEARSNAKFLGSRNVTLPDPESKTGRRSVWIVGGVVASQPAAAPGVGESARPRAAKPPRPRGALPPRADLAMIEVCGRA